MASDIEELEFVVDGISMFARRVPGKGTVYCHGNPTHGEDVLAAGHWP